MRLHIFNTVDELLQRLAEYFIDTANHAIATQGRFSVALSGGSSPENLYRLLAGNAFKNKTNWSNIFFFLGDERYVPATDPSNNYRMINKVLFEPLHIDTAQIFPVDTSLPPEEAADNYMENISHYFMGVAPRFDLVLLGLGDNSHTASLFPFTSILHESAATVKAVFLPEQEVYRISFTAPLINQAKNIAFLVYGNAKATAVQNIIAGEKDIEKFPAQLIQPESGNLEWFLDQSAATMI